MIMFKWSKFANNLGKRCDLIWIDNYIIIKILTCGADNKEI